MRDHVWQNGTSNLPFKDIDTGGIFHLTGQRPWDQDQKLQDVITD
jgi:hypothetical protein